MATESYRARAIRGRVSRRRILRSAAGAGGAFVLFSACGGSGGKKGSGGSSAPGLVTPVTDETKDLKRGGVARLNLTADIDTFDPHITSFPTQVPTTLAYN